MDVDYRGRSVWDVCASVSANLPPSLSTPIFHKASQIFHKASQSFTDLAFLPGQNAAPISFIYELSNREQPVVRKHIYACLNDEVGDATHLSRCYGTPALACTLAAKRPFNNFRADSGVAHRLCFSYKTQSLEQCGTYSALKSHALIIL